MTRATRPLSIALLSLALGGCASVGNSVSDAFANALNVGRITVPYDESAFPTAAPGTAVVTGQAFEKTNGGDVKYAAGDVIRLLPVTPFSDAYLKVMGGHTNIAGEGQFATGRYASDATNIQAMHAHELSTVADGSGHFEFKDVPAGSYHVYVRIEWMAGGETTGGLARADVTVETGKSYNVIVTG